MDILIVPKDCKRLARVTLPAPQDGTPQHYLCDEENLALYEIVKFSDPHRAWFIDNHLCREGHFCMVTRVDPLFMFVPVMMEFARVQFRPLHDICQEYESRNRAGTNKGATDGDPAKCAGQLSPLDCALSPYIYWQSICDTRDIDGDLFVRFSETRTMEWLLKKHDRLMESLGEEMGPKSSKATLMSHANDLLSDYIPKSLREKFKQMVRDKHTVGPDKR